MLVFMLCFCDIIEKKKRTFIDQATILCMGCYPLIAKDGQKYGRVMGVYTNC